jgi:hypothetical protein
MGGQDNGGQAEYLRVPRGDFSCPKLPGDAARRATARRTSQNVALHRVVHVLGRTVLSPTRTHIRPRQSGGWLVAMTIVLLAASMWTLREGLLLPTFVGLILAVTAGLFSLRQLI